MKWNIDVFLLIIHDRMADVQLCGSFVYCLLWLSCYYTLNVKFLSLHVIKWIKLIDFFFHHNNYVVKIRYCDSPSMEVCVLCWSGLGLGLFPYAGLREFNVGTHCVLRDVHFCFDRVLKQIKRILQTRVLLYLTELPVSVMGALAKTSWLLFWILDASCFP